MLEIDQKAAAKRWLAAGGKPGPVVIKELDLQDLSKELCAILHHGNAFLGCELEPATAGYIVENGGLVIHNFRNYAFKIHRAKLYDFEQLFEGFQVENRRGYFQSRDYKIYREYLNHGGPNPSSILVSLARRLHDHSITDALYDAITGRKVVAVMGGHSMERGDPFYARVAAISRQLTQLGFLMISGGGPGAMEATHLGAWFAQRPASDLRSAIKMLKQRPKGAIPAKEYLDGDWMHRAWKVREMFPVSETDKSSVMSVAIPTWLYGHEPPAPFATHYAKYFANSVREDGLLAIAIHGVIFAPGNAGTIQEIFQDAAQNRYGIAGYYSPMILLGEDYWTNEKPVWPLISLLAKDKPYGQLLKLTDDESMVVELIRRYDSQKFEVKT